MRCFVLMGVSGCGKTSVGQALRGLSFIDADDLHPAANVAKMASGAPLTDEDRGPWLDRVGQALRDTSGPVVMACSALRRRYRARILSSAGEPVWFLHLDAPKPVLVDRLAARKGHFMPPSLLDSQFAALEPLGGDEPGQTIDIARPLDAVIADCAAIIAAMRT